MGSQAFTPSQTRPRCDVHKASLGGHNHCTGRNPCGTWHHCPEQPSAWQHGSRNLPLWHSHQTACKESREVLSTPGRAQKGKEGERYSDTHFDPGPANTRACTAHCEPAHNIWDIVGDTAKVQTPKGSPQTAPCVSASRTALPCESTPSQTNNFLKHNIHSKSARPTVLTNAVSNHVHRGVNNHLLEARS